MSLPGKCRTKVYLSYFTKTLEEMPEMEKVKTSLEKRCLAVLLFFAVMIGIMSTNTFSYKKKLTLENSESVTKIAKLSQKLTLLIMALNKRILAYRTL